MIRFYCQYSFGGFRTFRIYGQENESLADQEVDKDNMLDFPQQCNLYFNYGGAKLLFRTLADGSYVIALRDIPGIEKDTDGRPINCALQIVGDPEDLPPMRNIVLAIINDVEKFQSGFTEGFSFRNGLYYDGRILADFVKNLEGVTLSAPDTELANLAFRKGPVYLFVPTSPLFKTDSKLASKVIAELQLGSTKDDRLNILQNTIPKASVPNLAGKIVTVTEEAETAPAATQKSLETKAGKKKEEKADKTVTETVTGTLAMISSGDNAADKLRIIDLERDLEVAEDVRKKVEKENRDLLQKIDEQADAMHRTRNILNALALGAAAVTAAFIISLFYK